MTVTVGRFSGADDPPLASEAPGLTGADDESPGAVGVARAERGTWTRSVPTPPAVDGSKVSDFVVVSSYVAVSVTCASNCTSKEVADGYGTN